MLSLIPLAVWHPPARTTCKLITQLPHAHTHTLSLLRILTRMHISLYKTEHAKQLWPHKCIITHAWVLPVKRHAMGTTSRGFLALGEHARFQFSRKLRFITLYFLCVCGVHVYPLSLALTWLGRPSSQSPTSGITFTSVVARQQGEKEKEGDCGKEMEVVAQEKNSHVVAKRRGEI